MSFSNKFQDPDDYTPTEEELDFLFDARRVLNTDKREKRRVEIYTDKAVHEIVARHLKSRGMTYSGWVRMQEEEYLEKMMFHAKY